jgi:hypothetical protein
MSGKPADPGGRHAHSSLGSNWRIGTIVFLTAIVLLACLLMALDPQQPY